MAPLLFPEEVDVFTIPHSRMKELVNKYREMLTETNFDDAFRMTSLLENLNTTFKEFKAHEQIENRCIMRKLKQKLRALSITNTAVCNCHKDNQLTEMMRLFKDGYRCTRKPSADRINYGLKLRQALEQFTDQFIPHMKEEEEVFQPLLMKYFTYEELRELKRLVLEEHWRTVAEEDEAKLVEDSLSSESSCDEEESNKKGHYSPFDLMPDELFLKILSYLNPKELGMCGRVDIRWSQLVADSKLWAHLFPVIWAKGTWTFSPELSEREEDEPLSQKEFTRAMLEEDADIDESMDSDSSESDNNFQQIKKEAKLIGGLTKHLLPKVGKGVKTLNLANSVGLTNGTLYNMLVNCPNVETLNVSQTRVSDLAFKGLGRSGCGVKLRHVDMSGCEKITDVTLQRLSAAMRTPHQAPGANTPVKNSENCAKLKSEQQQQHEDSESGKQQKTVLNKNSATNNVTEISAGSCPNSRAITDCSFEDCCSVQGKVSKGQSRNFVEYPGTRLISGIEQLELTEKAGISYYGCPFMRKTFDKNSEALCTDFDDIFPSHLKTACGVAGWPVRVNCDIREVTSIQLPPLVCDGVSPLLPPCLEFLSLSGCWLVTDDGLRSLADFGGLPCLSGMDLSGCLSITAAGLSNLVQASPKLDHANLFYCDNLENDPYPVTASGCQNLACGSRVCCRKGN